MSAVYPAIMLFPEKIPLTALHAGEAPGSLPKWYEISD